MKRPMIDPEFLALIPRPSEAERAALEASIAQAGRARDPLLVWRGILVDGHTRLEICTRLGCAYTTAELDPSPPNRAAVIAWIVENQCARRNLTRFGRTVLLARAGAERPPFAAQADWDLAHAALAMGLGDDAITGRLSQGLIRNRVHPPKPRAKAPRGPSGEHAMSPPVQLAEGQELKAQTVKVNADGTLAHRYDKSHTAREPAEFDTVPEMMHVSKVTTRLDADGRVGMQYVTASPDERRRWAMRLEAMRTHVALYRGVAEAVAAPDLGPAAEDLITVIPIGDPHIGMLSWAPETGENFDTKIACRELLATVGELIADAPASHRCIIANLGDALHAQDDSARTPGHGNQLDVDSRYPKILDALHVLFRGLVDAALRRFGVVEFRNLPGNHDPRVAAELAMWLAAVYEREPRVVIRDAFAAHQYDRFGCNLIGWHHGDRSKPAELPAIMASDHDGEGSGWWGETTEHVWHVGHVHHKTVKETPSCVVETHNTMAARDAYHAGRYRAKRRLQAITYHRAWGEHSRVTVSLARVRAAIGGAQ